jgi:hypothetical protein
MATITENLHVQGNFSVGGSFSPQDEAITRKKSIHQFPLVYAQSTAAVIASATVPIHIAYDDGTVIGVEVVALTAPTGGDKAFTVDVKKGNQATPAATILNSVITVNSTKADREVVVGSLATTAYADGDFLEVVVTASGSTGTQGTGLVVVVTVAESPGA